MVDRRRSFVTWVWPPPPIARRLWIAIAASALYSALVWGVHPFVISGKQLWADELAVVNTAIVSKKAAEDLWWQQPLLVAAFEIGNSTKHFVLRCPNGAPMTIQTKTSRTKKSKFVDFYVDRAGAVHAVETQRSEVTVTLSDNTRLELHQFTRELLNYWKKYLASIGVSVRNQPFAQLAGSVA